MMETHYTLGGGVSVTVADDGEAVPPWDGATGTVFRYRLAVIAPAGEYRSPGYGSLHDYERGERDHGGMAGMILGEVFSAYADPDEHWRMIAEGWKGVPDRGNVLRVLDTIAYAERIGPAIERALSGVDGYAEVPEDLDACLRCGRSVVWSDGSGCYVVPSQALPAACGPPDTSAYPSGATLRGHNPYPRSVTLGSPQV